MNPKPLRVKMILPALTEAKSPFFRPIKYSLFPSLGLASLAAYLGKHLGELWAASRNGKKDSFRAQGAGTSRFAGRQLMEIRQRLKKQQPNFERASR